MRSQTLALTVAFVLTESVSLADDFKERAVFQKDTIMFQCAVLSPDGKLLATGGYGNRRFALTLWDAASGKEIASLPDLSDMPQTLAFSADGKLLACGEGKARVIIWDVASRKQLTALKGEDEYNPAHGLAFNAVGNRLVTVDLTSVTLWDWKEGKKLSSFQRRMQAWTMAVSPDLKVLAFPNYQEIELWDTAGGREQALLSEHRGAVHRMAFSRDGRTLAAASTWRRLKAFAWTCSGEIRLWDVATARERVKIKGEFGEILDLALSPDEKSLAVVETKDLENAEFKLIDAATGRTVLSRSGKARGFATVTFAADGTLYCLDSSDRQKLKLWELPPRKESK